MNKKGQAAMEFLMTYGWAILVAIIVVGVLWYLIGNPANLAGNRFQLSAPMVANALVLSSSGISIEIRNGAGESINVSEIVVQNCATLSGLSSVVPQGGLENFTIVCSPALSAGDRFNGDVTLRYSTPGSNLPQDATGSISGRVT